MKKNYILMWIIAFVFCIGDVSYAFGGNEMGREYTVTINGIKIYSKPAMDLLEQIAKEGKEIVNIVDNSTKKRLDATPEVLRPGLDISISNSKNLAEVLKLFEILKEHATNFNNKIIYKSILGNKNVSSMKDDDGFCISTNNDKSRVFLCIDNRIQVSKASVFIGNSSTPSEIENAEPVPE